MDGIVGGEHGVVPLPGSAWGFLTVRGRAPQRAAARRGLRAAAANRVVGWDVYMDGEAIGLAIVSVSAPPIVPMPS